MHPLVYLLILIVVAGLTAVQYAVGGWELAITGLVGLALGGALGAAIAKVEMSLRERKRPLPPMDEKGRDERGRPFL